MGADGDPGRRLLLDYPPMNVDQGRFPLKLFGAEFIGTALLIAVGLSFVIADFGQGSPVIPLLPSAAARRLLTGFLFGTTGGLIAVSPFGRESGAHINPAVTFAFWLAGRLPSSYAAGYVICQLAGALLGAAPLLVWGQMGRSIGFGATVPGSGYGPLWALLGEAATTFALIFALFVFLCHRRLRAFTPAIFAPLYAIMVWLEAPISGTSTNPARSLGPSVISGLWDGWWIYWLGPLFGTLIALGVFRMIRREYDEIEVAKIYHFKHDRYGIFRLSKS
jgi:aquaporin Z